MTMTRKEFLRSLLGVGVGVGAAGIAAMAACGNDSDDGTKIDAGATDAGATDAPPGTCTSPTSVIGANHGHTLVISQADVDAGVQKDYDITGASDHPHTVTITAAQFAQIKSGETISVTSSTDDAHSHPVTVMCAS